MPKVGTWSACARLQQAVAEEKYKALETLPMGIYKGSEE
jgi:hypothetical protein